MIGPRAYEGTEPYIFVSYSHNDSDRVLPIISALQERGFRVWYDAGIEAGTEWPEYIAEHLDGCSTFLAFLSKHAIDSHNCRREINFAIELRKDPLVIHLEDTQMSLGMRMQLSTLQAMFRNRHSTQDSFLDELCRNRLLAPCRGSSNQKDEAELFFNRAKTAYDNGDYLTATKGYLLAADLGHAEAQYALGCCFDNGIGIPEDKDAAIRWYREAAKQGYADAQNRLAYCYDTGHGITQDYSEAAKWYRKAADQGLARAQCNLGHCYKIGHGVEQNDTEAVKWYRKAAQQGHAGAQFCLANGYLSGKGVSQDYLEAVNWYQKAAQQGNPLAQYALGCCYIQGIGVTKNYLDAVHWYQKAAEQGNYTAQYDLGLCYEYGRGVALNEAEAIEWYRKAANQGFTAAQNVLQDKGLTW